MSAAQGKERFDEYNLKQLEGFCGPVGWTTVDTAMVISSPCLLTALYNDILDGDEEDRRIAALILRWMLEALFAEPGQNAQCLVCMVNFEGIEPEGLEFPTSVLLVENFEKTHALVFGICDKCFVQAQAAGEPVDYLRKYYQALRPDTNIEVGGRGGSA
jgi:hypothetical protein